MSNFNFCFYFHSVECYQSKTTSFRAPQTFHYHHEASTFASNSWLIPSHALKSVFPLLSWSPILLTIHLSQRMALLPTSWRREALDNELLHHNHLPTNDSAFLLPSAAASSCTCALQPPLSILLHQLSLPFTLNFSYSRSMCAHAQLCLDSATPWTVNCQAPVSMEFSTQEYWVGCHFLLGAPSPKYCLPPIQNFKN